MRKDMQPKIVKAKTLKEILTPERCYICENWGVSMGDRQVSIACARVEPGVSTKAHHLEGVQEIYLVFEGEGIVYVGNMEPAEVCKGDVVIIPPGTSQKIANTGKSDLVFYCICTPAFTQECYRSDET
jgi:mannose-6-phosphate isomerase-like protein (cupin superfamily)